MTKKPLKTGEQILALLGKRKKALNAADVAEAIPGMSRNTAAQRLLCLFGKGEVVRYLSQRRGIVYSRP